MYVRKMYYSMVGWCCGRIYSLVYFYQFRIFVVGIHFAVKKVLCKFQRSFPDCIMYYVCYDRHDFSWINLSCHRSSIRRHWQALQMTQLYDVSSGTGAIMHMASVFVSFRNLTRDVWTEGETTSGIFETDLKQKMELWDKFRLVVSPSVIS